MPKGKKPSKPFDSSENNPAKRRPLGIRAMLRDRYGDNAESLFDMLDTVATGTAEVIQEKVGPEGSIIELTVRPTISERTTAIIELMAYSIGKPVQVNLNANVDLAPQQMTDDQLREKVEQFLSEGSRPPQPLPQPLPEAKDATVTVKKG